MWRVMLILQILHSPQEQQPFTRSCDTLSNASIEPTNATRAGSNTAALTSLHGTRRGSSGRQTSLVVGHTGKNTSGGGLFCLPFENCKYLNLLLLLLPRSLMHLSSASSWPKAEWGGTGGHLARSSGRKRHRPGQLRPFFSGFLHLMLVHAPARGS